MTAPLPAWTIEELRAMTPEERRIWQVERATSWAKAVADAVDDPAASLGCALACLSDATSIMRAMEAIRCEERPARSFQGEPIVLTRGQP